MKQGIVLIRETISISTTPSLLMAVDDNDNSGGEDTLVNETQLASKGGRVHVHLFARGRRECTLQFVVDNIKHQSLQSCGVGTSKADVILLPPCDRNRREHNKKQNETDGKKTYAQKLITFQSKKNNLHHRVCYPPL